MKKCVLKHVIYMTKLFTIAFTLQCLSISLLLASNGNAQVKSIEEVPVHLSLNEVKVVKAFKELERITEFNFVFAGREVRDSPLVSVESKGESLYDLLLSIATQSNLHFKQIDQNIHVKRSDVKNFILVSESVDVTVSGTVTDENGDPIPGATVLIEGTTTGTATDIDGNFTLEAAEGSVLLISFIGYQPQRITVGNQTNFSITLLEDQSSLEEVLVVGYGVQKKVNLTGAVGSIDSDQIKGIPVSNLSNALAGRIPGLAVTTATGRPGATSAIRIRGRGTWNNSSPLYVIDGIVRDQNAFDGIDPSEVETINVLKDAASSAIYGARAANGVILVTTKRGKEQKPVITYKALVGTERFTRTLDKPGSYESAVYANEGWINQGFTEDYPGYYSPDELAAFKTGAYDLNWFDMVQNTPVIQQHNLGVSGGSENIRYYFSAGTYDATGMIKNLSYKRNNIRANVEASITDNLTFSVNLDANLRNENKYYWNRDNDALNDTYKALYEMPFNMTPYDGNGFPDGTFYHIHPVEVINSGSYRKDRTNSYNALLALDYKVPFIEGMKVRASYSSNTVQDFRKIRYNHYMLYVHASSSEHNHLTTDEIINERLIQRSPYEFIDQRHDSRSSYQANVQLNYNRTFNNHGVDAVLGYEQSETEIEWFGGRVEEFYTHAIDQMFAGSRDPERRNINGSASEIGRQSVVGRVNYNYLSKYIVEASFRYDGSVVFAPGNRWGFFPSLSAGWRISEESFMEKISMLDHLKIRASIGNLGNDAVGSYQWLQQYNFSNGGVFGSPTNGLVAGRFPNENITWEKSTTYNIGLEGELWNGHLTFEIDYFHRHSYDILRSRIRTIPGTFGASLPFENYAQIDNQGIEISIGHRNTIGELNYYMQGNVGFANEKVVRIDVGANERDFMNPIGHPLNAIWGYESAGIIQTQEQLDSYPEDFRLLGRKPELGMLMYKDIRGANSDEPDGVVDANDRNPISRKVDPRINFGFLTGLAWKKLSFDLLFQGIAGKDVLIGPRNQRLFKTPWPWAMNRWSPENPDGTAPRAIDGGRDAQNQPSDYWLRNASFVRLKNLQIAYDASNELFRRIGINDISVFVNGTNLFLLDHIKYYDPEIGGGGNAYPLTKNYSLGLNISF